MEDVNMLAADCVVISCCCQCLILQILIFILLKLPYKLLRKMKDYKKKFRSRKQGAKTMQIELATYEEDSFRKLGNSFKIDIQDHVCLAESLRLGCCMNEIDVLLEELSSKALIHADQLKDIFDRFDMDHDGSLTQLELATLLRSLGLKPTGDQIQVMLADMDANSNGLIGFDELLKAILLLPDMNEQVLINQEQLVEVFRWFDRDGNGFISVAELAGQMAKMGQPLTYKELKKMMQEADANGDGVISFNEFANVMTKSGVDYLVLTVF